MYKYIGPLIICMIPVGVYLFIFLRRTVRFYFSGLLYNKKSLDTVQDAAVQERRYKLRRVITDIIIVILSVFILSLCVNVFSLRSMIILHLLATAVVFELVNLVYKIISKRNTARIWKKLYRSGVLPLALTALILLYGFIHMGHVEEKDYAVYTDKSIRSEGYTIALVSDLHLGNSLKADDLQQYFNEIEEKKPDIMVLCGDIFDESSKLTEMQKAAEIIGNTKTAYGIFYVYGNHDRATYSNKADFTPPELAGCLTSNGITILSDMIYEVNDEFTIIGREDARFGGSSGRKETKAFMQEIDKDDFILMLDHQPVELKSNSEQGVDLQLSGHTHGGQIWPVGLISDMLGFGELNYGYKKIDDFQVIVSSGISGWGYPIRTGSNSEYVIVKVLPNK